MVLLYETVTAAPPGWYNQETLSPGGGCCTFMASELIPRRPVRRAVWLRPAAGLLLLLTLAGLHASGLFRSLGWDTLRAHLAGWQATADAAPALAAGAFLLAWLGLTALSMPAAPLLLLCGALFGLPLGLPVALISGACGAVSMFLASRYLFRDWVEDRFGARLRPLHAGVERDGAWYLLTLRLLPVVPYPLINLGMALTPMRLLPFVLCTVPGMLPACLLYVHAGTHLSRLERPEDVLSPTILLTLAALAVLPLVLRPLLRRGRVAR